MLKLDIKKSELFIKKKDSSHQEEQEPVMKNDSKHQGQALLKIQLCIHKNSKLEKMFPNDKSANTILKCGRCEFHLNNAHLRIESAYFEQLIEETERFQANDHEKNVKPLKLIESDKRNKAIKVKWNEENGKCVIEIESARFKDNFENVFEKVLRCLYGGECMINENEIYQAYVISQELQIEKLVSHLEQEIQKNFKSLNFFMVLSLALMYNVETLSDKCKKKLELTLFSEILETSSPQKAAGNRFPQNFIELELPAIRFIFLINQENHCLNTQQLFTLIKAYSTQNNNNTCLIPLCREFIPFESISSEEYGHIQSLMQPKVFEQYIAPSMVNKNLIESKLVENKRIFELECENIFYQKRLKETERKNEFLQAEMSKIKMDIETKTEEFRRSEEQERLKLSNLEMKVSRIEVEEQNIKQEFAKKIDKLKNKLREQELEIKEKNRQVESLHLILEKLSTMASANQERASPNVRNDLRPPTREGSFCPQPCEEFYESKQQIYQKKSEETNSMMTVQSVNISGNCMLESQATNMGSHLESPEYNVFYSPQVKMNPLKLSSPNHIMPFGEVQRACKTPSSDQQYEGGEETRTQEQSAYFEQFVAYEFGGSKRVEAGFAIFEEPSRVLDDSKEDYQTMLADFFDLSWYRKMRLKLLYRSSRDGFTKCEFDEKVTGIKETIILIKSWEYDKIFGGFLSIPWPANENFSHNGFSRDENAFLFSISNNVKIPITNPDCALYCGEDFLFSLGTSDLCILENGDEDEINTSKYPCDYQTTTTNCKILSSFLAGNSRFQVDELEVYSIEYEQDMEL